MLLLYSVEQACFSHAHAVLPCCMEYVLLYQPAAGTDQHQRQHAIQLAHLPICTTQHVVLTALGCPTQVVDFLGREPGSSKLTGYEKVRPLVNQQVAMKNREQISEGLLTGE